MLRLLLVSMTLTVLRSTGHAFWDLFGAFLMIRLELWGKTPEVKCHFHHITSRAHTVHMTDHAEVDLGTWLRCVVRGLHCEVTLLLPLHTVLLRWEAPHSPHLWSGSFSSFPRGQGVYIHYLEFFCIGDLFLFSHLLIQSFICIRISSRLLFASGCNPILFYFYFCLNCSRFGHWENFQLVQ